MFINVRVCEHLGLGFKRIEDKSCRQVAFCKRRKGLMKKAKELSILCDVDVGAVIISNRGRLHDFSSTNSLTGILQRYEGHVESEKEISEEIKVAEQSKYSSMKMGELLQTTERQLEEPNADSLPVTDLIHLEKELQTTLMQIRSRKEKMLREENKLLEVNRAWIKKNINVNEISMDFTDLPPPHILCGQERVTLDFL
ncbi:truncated transcription factor CAULIFLOWER A isoform X5 [Capsicum annuum]|uniref:truncated transcription factor CAULIFLOWER A isoform X5 n=1 Tax=Capsicum annuum TaxID=4072 RepID=UPI001FB0DA14|nr:truncated transcription factor CAULIFLOWER A isoform X5 [Capsicum annuum]